MLIVILSIHSIEFTIFDLLFLFFIILMSRKSRLDSSSDVMISLRHALSIPNTLLPLSYKAVELSPVRPVPDIFLKHKAEQFHEVRLIYMSESSEIGL